MEEVKLTRTDRRPLVFMGETILETNNRTVNGPNQNRWTKISIHKTDKGKYVAGIGHVTCWQGERDHYSVEVFNSIEAVVDHLEEHAPQLAEEVALRLGVVERL